jgi:hypothetical protein
VLWGYFTRCLTPNLLQPTDHHALNFGKKLIRLGRQSRRREDGAAIQSQKQQRRGQALVAFIKILSDQQLITGLAILIAALASQCQISVYEWRIVSSLCYFSATTHSLTLDVLRDYLYMHTCVRYCRILLTLVFLVLFSFVFILDHLLYRLNEPNQIVQCMLLNCTEHRLYANSYFVLTSPVLVLL